MADPLIENSTGSESTESFEDLFLQYEQSHARKAEEADQGREGTVVAVTADSVLVDIGFKSEGVLPLADFQSRGETIKPGDKLLVTVKGRTPEGYYELSRGKVSRPTDWAALEKSFADRTTILGTVTAVVKGGLSVDVGVRAFMPASRSGARDASEIEKLVGQEIRCRIIKLDSTEEDVVVDRRAVAEEEEADTKQRRYSEMKEGDTVRGTVRTLADYGAFVDIGGVDGLLHVSDLAWSRVNKPADVLSVGQEIEVRILKIDREKNRISLGMKQLAADPWDAAVEKYKPGDRVRGTVTRVMDFGAFVELEPGIEGLVHVSEMSWAKKIRAASDVVKPGETVDVVVLGVNAAERRLSLGLKQALGNPWIDAAQKFAVGSTVEGRVTNVTKFGAFVEVSEGVEGMVHISEISAEKRINHPQDVLKVGQLVQATVLAVEPEKRIMRLSMKQLVPTGVDEYLVEHKAGDVVSGRVVEVSGDAARVELGQGIQGHCRLAAKTASEAGKPESSSSPADLSSLTSMLQARWKNGADNRVTKPESVQPGQIRKFRITKLEVAAKRIELELQ
jgi:small subunit ribosomal protein S1